MNALLACMYVTLHMIKFSVKANGMQATMVIRSHGKWF